MTEKNIPALSWEDAELDSYFMISVQTEEGLRYVFNKRTLVHDIHFAKRFETKRSAQRCVKLSGFENWEILKFARTN